MSVAPIPAVRLSAKNPTVRVRANIPWLPPAYADR